MSARNTALAALIACRRRDAWSDRVLQEYLRRDKLDARDAALAARLCYGVLQNRLLLDFYLSRFVKQPLKKLQPVVLDILRLGVYQLTMTSRIPASAAINEAVGQAARSANRQAAGLVNGVLRSIARAGENLPEPPDLSTRYSHPAPLVELLRENAGEELLEPLLQSNNSAPPAAVQHNPLRCRETELLNAWDAQGIAWTRHPWMPGCFQLTGSPAPLPGFQEGWFYVQDAAARLAVRAAGLKPGMRVLDCCAAPGGKSFAAAIELQDRGEILSCDIYPHKLPLIEEGAERLGAKTVKAVQQDAAVFREEWAGQMDAVLADVPCSGLGVIRKKPDIRYKDPAQMERLPELQSKILQNAGRYVKPGGVLLYSTCTILKRENEAVTEDFLERNREFHPEPMTLPEALHRDETAILTLLPCTDECDGFFLAKLRKTV